MRVRDEQGETHTAKLSTDHAASSYGQPVLVIGREAFGTADVGHLVIVKATAKERAELARYGYRLPEVG